MNIGMTSNNTTILPVKAVANNLFPSRLHDMLDDAERKGYTHIVSWNQEDNGKSFIIHQSGVPLVSILRHYFRQTQYKSFLRQLQGYGFTRITRGDDKGRCSHPQLQRGLRSKSVQMKRKLAANKAVVATIEETTTSVAGATETSGTGIATPTILAPKEETQKKQGVVADATQTASATASRNKKISTKGMPTTKKKKNITITSTGEAAPIKMRMTINSTTDLQQLQSSFKEAQQQEEAHHHPQQHQHQQYHPAIHRRNGSPDAMDQLRIQIGCTVSNSNSNSNSSSRSKRRNNTVPATVSSPHGQDHPHHHPLYHYFSSLSSSSSKRQRSDDEGGDGWGMIPSMSMSSPLVPTSNGPSSLSSYQNDSVPSSSFPLLPSSIGPPPSSSTTTTPQHCFSIHSGDNNTCSFDDQDDLFVLDGSGSGPEETIRTEKQMQFQKQGMNVKQPQNFDQLGKLSNSNSNNNNNDHDFHHQYWPQSTASTNMGTLDLKISFTTKTTTTTTTPNKSVRATTVPSSSDMEKFNGPSVLLLELEPTPIGPTSSLIIKNKNNNNNKTHQQVVITGGITTTTTTPTTTKLVPTVPLGMIPSEVSDDIDEGIAQAFTDDLEEELQPQIDVNVHVKVNAKGKDTMDYNNGDTVHDDDADDDDWTKGVVYTGIEIDICGNGHHNDGKNTRIIINDDPLPLNGPAAVVAPTFTKQQSHSQLQSQSQLQLQLQLQQRLQQQQQQEQRIHQLQQLNQRVQQQLQVVQLKQQLQQRVQHEQQQQVQAQQAQQAQAQQQQQQIFQLQLQHQHQHQQHFTHVLPSIVVPSQQQQQQQLQVTHLPSPPHQRY